MPTWTARTERLSGGRALRFAVDGATCADVLRLWQTDVDFRMFFIALLAEAPFTAFRWETPPVTASTADRPFEFVLLDDPALVRTPDPSAFAKQFRPGDAALVASFPNLGGDAVLVVPRPLGPPSAYGHLASFVRDAPEPQRHALWECVGRAMGQRLGPRPVWLSTAGAGVPWLHVRLDDRPKYYHHRPYRDDV